MNTPLILSQIINRAAQATDNSICVYDAEREYNVSGITIANNLERVFFEIEESPLYEITSDVFMAMVDESPSKCDNYEVYVQLIPLESWQQAYPVIDVYIGDNGQLVLEAENY